MTLGEHILILRKKHNLSQAALGKLVDTSGDIIGRYERNEIKPFIDTAKAIADELGVTVDFLIGGENVVIDKQLLKKLGT